jgi:hypothetical protein
MGGALEREPGPWTRAVPYLLAAAAYSLFHVLLIGLGGTLMSAGNLIGPDSYMRLVRVTELYETGAWFDITIERSNAPYGDDLHWTRPYDVVVLAGAWVLTPFLGFETALFRWGSLVSPIFHVALGVAAAWATSPFLCGCFCAPWCRLRRSWPAW